MTQNYILGMTVRGGEGSSIVGTSGNNNVQQFESGALHNNHVRHHRNEGRPFKDTIGSAQVLASKKFTGLYTGPYFDPGMPRNITAQMGDTALITCNVNQIGKFQVHIRIIILTFITQCFKKHPGYRFCSHSYLIIGFQEVTVDVNNSCQGMGYVGIL